MENVYKPWWDSGLIFFFVLLKGCVCGLGLIKLACPHVRLLIGLCSNKSVKSGLTPDLFIYFLSLYLCWENDLTRGSRPSTLSWSGSPNSMTISSRCLFWLPLEEWGGSECLARPSFSGRVPQNRRQSDSALKTLFGPPGNAEKRLPDRWARHLLAWADSSVSYHGSHTHTHAHWKGRTL